MCRSALAHAVDFKETPVYYPDVRPGYVGWANLFQFGNGDIGAAFQEIRRGENPDCTPPPLEYVEAVGIPYTFVNVCEPLTNPDMVSEFVHMISSDGGRTWRLTGRRRVRRRHYWYVGFPDGKTVRLYGGTGYQNPHCDSTCATVEESPDGGNTWTRIAHFLEGYYVNMFKFRKLSDGRLIAAGPIRPSWGPGEKIVNRHVIAPGQIESMEAAFFVSEDQGHSWTGPHYVFPGITAWEFDFVELPGGDLLFINSTIQHGRAARQIVRRTATGYVNDPLMTINRGAPQTAEGWIAGDGIVPETVAITSDGLLVGALRGRPYACSKDLGENWYEIEGPPVSPYQPMCDLLPDGSVINIWHEGSDNSFGEQDMFIGVHRFRVDASNVPEPTRLALRREMSDSRDQYLNVFSATLTSSGEPVTGETVELRTSPVWLPNRRANPTDVSESDDVRTAVTDERGIALFKLHDKDRIPDLHAGYWVMPRYVPPDCSPYAACVGEKYFAYPITPMRNRPAHLDVCMEHGNILITPQVAELFPDLARVTAALDPHDPDQPRDAWVHLAGSEQRADEILDLFMRHHLLRLEGGVYRWYRWVVRDDMPVIGEVRVTENEDIAV